MGVMLKWDYPILYLSTIIGKFILHNPFWYLHIGITLEGSKKGEAEGSIQQNPLLVVPLDLDECPMGQQFQRQQELKLWWCSFLPQASMMLVQQSHMLVCLCAGDFFFTLVPGLISYSGESEHWIYFQCKILREMLAVVSRSAMRLELKISLAGVESRSPAANTSLLRS